MNTASTRPCTRPVHGRPHCHVHGCVVYTGRVHSCIRAMYTAMYGPCTRYACTSRVQTARKRPYTRPCTSRVREQGLYTAVYVHGPCWAVYTAVYVCAACVHGRVDGHTRHTARTRPWAWPMYQQITTQPNQDASHLVGLRSVNETGQHL